jgi:hypothetical protein
MIRKNAGLSHYSWATEPFLSPSIVRQSATPKAVDFYIFPFPRTDGGQRESFLGFQAAHDFILRFGAEHDVDRTARVALTEAPSRQRTRGYKRQNNSWSGSRAAG